MKPVVFLITFTSLFSYCPFQGLSPLFINIWFLCFYSLCFIVTLHPQICLNCIPDCLACDKLHHTASNISPVFRECTCTMSPPPTTSTTGLPLSQAICYPRPLYLHNIRICHKAILLGLLDPADKRNTAPLKFWDNSPSDSVSPQKTWIFTCSASCNLEQILLG